MVYNWDPYKDECYDLYVNQRKGVTEIAKYIRGKYGFDAKVRTFHHKFKKWQFPLRNDPVRENDQLQLVARVKELWSQNLTAPQMLRVLTEEDGYDLDVRKLQDIRSKHGFMLRTKGPAFGLTDTATRLEKLKHATITNDANEEGRTSQERGASLDDGEEIDDESDEEMEDEEVGETQQEERWADIVPAVEATPEILVQDLSPEELAAVEMRKQQRMMELQAESMARWATKKRRRRTKGYLGLPADPPCPPRFPSETTLSETKVILGLDGEAYSTVRKAFSALCQQEGVIKKTIAGPEKWEALKDRLIRESIHLRSAMWDQTDIERKKLAIDIICCDVTKQMRVMGTRLSVAKAKTILNLDPEQGRQIRSALYLLLAQEKFTSKAFEGKAQWEAIKARWYDSSELMRRLSQFERPDCPDPNRHQKAKALDYLALDATRRYREESFRKGKNILEDMSRPPAESSRAKTKGPGSGAKPKGAKPATANQPKQRGRAAAKGKTQPARSAVGRAHTEARLAPVEIIEVEVGPQPIDPLLDTPTRALRWRPPQGLQQQPEFDTQFDTTFSDPAPGVVSNAQTMASQPAPAPAPVYHAPPRRQRTQATPAQAQPQNRSVQPPQQPPPAPASMAVFYKLHPGTALPSHMAGPSMWISTVSQHPTVDEVRAAALAKYPSAMCFAIEGIVKDGRGGELPLPVSDDMELDAYLQHVQGNANVTGHSAAPTFVVQLMA